MERRTRRNEVSDQTQFTWKKYYNELSLIEMFLIRLRHQQAKDVVLGLRESIKEKDDIIKELKDQFPGKKEGSSETSLKTDCNWRSSKYGNYAFLFMTFALS